MSNELSEENQKMLTGLQDEINGLIRFQPEGWEQQIEQITLNMDDIKLGNLAVRQPSNTPLSMVKAAANRVPYAAGQTLQLGADAVNYMTGGEQKTADGEPVRDRFGTPMQRPDLIDFPFSERVIL